MLVMQLQERHATATELQAAQSPAFETYIVVCSCDDTRWLCMQALHCHDVALESCNAAYRAVMQEEMCCEFAIGNSDVKNKQQVKGAVADRCFGEWLFPPNKCSTCVWRPELCFRRDQRQNLPHLHASAGNPVHKLESFLSNFSNAIGARQRCWVQDDPCSQQQTYHCFVLRCASTMM